MPQYILENYNIEGIENQEEVGNLHYKLSLTPAKETFHTQMHELNKIGFLAINSHPVETTSKYSLVRSATGDSFQNISELKVMNYDKGRTSLASGQKELSAGGHKSINFYMGSEAQGKWSWATLLLDIKGAFLKGQFENEEVLYMGVPQGFERSYAILERTVKNICVHGFQEKQSRTGLKIQEDKQLYNIIDILG
eukprot:5923368-Ditylum_brightwellii.AAC.1